ncbi:hypothetical protein TWF173_001913 [Orbilia oligospora]|nr:hypothetical protein TWF173_001913 [Orbilia oligospora]
MKQDTGPNTTSKLAAQRLTETHEMDTLDSKCYFAKLPVELKTEILSYFPRWQLLKISATCKDFRSICLRHYIKEVHIRTSNRGGCLKLLERYPDIRLAVRYLKIDIFKSGKDKWATPKLWDPIDYYGTDDEDSGDLTLEDGTVTKIRSEGTEITFEGRRVELRHSPVAEIFSKFFPNVEELFLLEVQMPNALELEYAYTFQRDEEWSAMKKLRKVQMEAYEIFEEDLSCCVEAAKDSTRALIERWYADGMKDLELLKFCVYDSDKCFELHLTYTVKRRE